MYGVAGDYQKDRERRDPRHSNDRNAACMIRMGFRLTTIANDSGLMAKAARESVAGVWREVDEFR